MNRYILIRRLMGPSILLLIGVVALLHEAHLVHWSLLVPLLLILIGVFKLAARAALAAEGGYPPYQYPGSPYSAPPYPAAAGVTPPVVEPQSSPSPAEPAGSGESQTSGRESEGGQS